MPGNTSAEEKLIWHDEHHLQVGDTNFRVEIDWATCDTTESTPEEFLLVKTKPDTETILNHLPRRVDNMVEFGIFKGGSIALYEELYSPRRLVGVDIKPERVDALDEFRKRRSATDRVRLYYGVDQSDPGALEAIIRENFAEEAVDLVVDDGSHRYGPTKASLNRFLPLLRTGGVYLIEDWAWAHWPRQELISDQFDDEPFPLSKLIFEVEMFAASNPLVIRHVIIDHNRAFIVRGDGSWETNQVFDVSEAYRTSLWSFDFMLRNPSIGETCPPTRSPDQLSATSVVSTRGESPNATHRVAPIDVWRSWIPLSVRKMVPPRFGAWARRHIPG